MLELLTLLRMSSVEEGVTVTDLAVFISFYTNHGFATFLSPNTTSNHCPVMIPTVRAHCSKRAQQNGIDFHAQVSNQYSQHVSASSVPLILQTILQLVCFIFIFKTVLICLLGLDCDRYCCDGNAHTDGFRLQDHLPGPIWIQPLEQDSKRKAVTDGTEIVNDEENEDSDKEIVDHSRKRRKPAHCKPLVERLLRWRSAEHDKDPLKDFWPEYFIITDPDILRICQVHPINLTSTGVIISTVDKPLDGDFARLWAQKIFDVITVFDSQYKVRINRIHKVTKRQRTSIDT